MLSDRYYLADLKARVAQRDRNPFDDERPGHMRELFGKRSDGDAYDVVMHLNGQPVIEGAPGQPYPLIAIPLAIPPRPHHFDPTTLYEEPDPMSYRPITDLWILARPKVKYYGAYPAGFLSRARAMLGVRPDDPVLHVCSGKVRDYPFAGLGPNDLTLDGNPELAPDFVIDVTDDTPLPPGFAAILTDPPYTPEDAAQYGSLPFPSASTLMKKCLEAVEVGSRVGMLHYEWPACPDFAKEIAVVGVTTGRRQRMRHFVVMERIS